MRSLAARMLRKAVPSTLSTALGKLASSVSEAVTPDAYSPNVSCMCARREAEFIFEHAFVGDAVTVINRKSFSTTFLAIEVMSPVMFGPIPPSKLRQYIVFPSALSYDEKLFTLSLRTSKNLNGKLKTARSYIS